MTSASFPLAEELAALEALAKSRGYWLLLSRGDDEVTTVTLRQGVVATSVSATPAGVWLLRILIERGS